MAGVVVPVAEQAVWAWANAVAAVAESASAVCWAVTTACWASAKVGRPFAAVTNEAVVAAAPVVDGVPPAADELELEPDEPDELELEPDDWDDSSSESLACAEVRVDWADDTVWVSDVGSTVARGCPAVTCWPTATFTAETVPATWKSAVAWLTGSALPETVSVCRTEVVVARAVR